LRIRVLSSATLVSGSASAGPDTFWLTAIAGFLASGVGTSIPTSSAPQGFLGTMTMHRSKFGRLRLAGHAEGQFAIDCPVGVGSGMPCFLPSLARVAM
jgi:hypothetical protein